MQKNCPFINEFCCEENCGLFNVGNEKCAFLLMSEIMASRTKEYRTSDLDPIPVKVVDYDGN